MKKSELIDRVAAEFAQMAVSNAERAVNVILDRMKGTMAKRRRVEIRRFGVFTVRQRPARPGRNSRTGEAVDIPAKTVPLLKTGKDLRDRLQQGPPLSPSKIVPSKLRWLQSRPATRPNARPPLAGRVATPLQQARGVF